MQTSKNKKFFVAESVRTDVQTGGSLRGGPLEYVSKTRPLHK